MKIHFSLIFVLSFLWILNLQADDEVQETADNDNVAINKCLSNWDNPPFKKGTAKYKTFGGSVHVFGVGGQITDDEKTDSPKLILVKPDVNVLGKSTIRLMNPQGWYCLKPTVSVLAKTRIEMSCKAHVISTSSGTNVLGASDEEQGIVVLGSLRIKKIGCD